ncbi:Putative esterase OS=Pseudomonas putida CSV86 GN=CSV86_27162 PE=4 SV=1 [Gemmata massiliana]|uniref:Uncharacterized protein n=1 Tax=Gemmata massiliana TaxID=1210884 RepID=A0A6P2CXU9_9BACT|nr:hypothetical protein [Gemmata massiliana]VTR93729.1 Putative esterase OS=Pseudomonas putida CSV86 GN=CSV86_27162 PE=4 SV=1 [Gemmata massiliana]
MRLSGIALIVLASMAVTIFAADPTPVVIPRTEQFDVKSKNGLEYRIFVAAPTGKAPDAGYPVIYLSDGNGNFPTVHSAARRLSMNDLSAVVVGIGYPTDETKVHNERRSFDLTPPTSAEWLTLLRYIWSGCDRRERQ